MCCDYSMLAMLYKISELYFRLLGTKGFHVKAENERFTAAVRVENFTSLFGRLRQKIAPKGVPHVQRDYSSSLNQSIHCCVELLFPFPSSYLNLPITEFTQQQQLRHIKLHLKINICAIVTILRLLGLLLAFYIASKLG